MEDQFQSLHEALQRARGELKNNKITGNDIIDFYGEREEISNSLESLLGGLSSISAKATRFTENLDSVTDSTRKLSDAKITIKAELEVSDDDVKNQLEQIQQIVLNREPIKIPVEIDDEKVKRLSEQLESVTKSIPLIKPVEFDDFDTSGYRQQLSSITQIYNGMAEDGKRASTIITEHTDGFGKTISIVDNLNKKTDEYETSLTRINDNYKEQSRILT